MAETISPSVKTTRAAIVNVVVGIRAVMPGKPRTVAWMTTSTMIPASRRISGGIIGRKSSIRLDCFDITRPLFPTRDRAAEKLPVAEPTIGGCMLH